MQFQVGQIGVVLFWSWPPLYNTNFEMSPSGKKIHKHNFGQCERIQGESAFINFLGRISLRVEQISEGAQDGSVARIVEKI